MGSYDDEDDDYGTAAWAKRHACRCGGDMPGHCPGPANCPMERATSEEDTD